MSEHNDAPNETTVLDVDLSRRFFKQLMASAYHNPSLTTDDAIAMASLASAIDEFLVSNETERRAALTLKTKLNQIVSNSSWGNEIQNSQKAGKHDPSKNYYTSDGKIVYLGTMLGGGGEGTVYKIPNMPGKVAKVFRPTSDIAYMERKIEAIIENHIPSRLDNILICTLPETLLYDDEDKFIGYIMPWITTKFKFYDVTRSSVTRKKYFPELDYRGLIIIAYNLSEIINSMHEHEVVVGDLNFSNIVINSDGTVCLIDTDSYDIVDRKTKEHFKCMVGLPEMLAPELQTVGRLKNGVFTKETDDFSLAILIFRLLMNNADPFSGARTSDFSKSISNIPANAAIINGECPYVKEIDGIMIPEWAPAFDILPSYIRELFIRVFDYTATSFTSKINERPTAKEWMNALMRFYNEPLVQCERDTFHWYRSELDECPFCSRINTSIPAKRIEVQEKKKGFLENLKNIITVEI